jgi:glycerophosphoryl diester phosphodiesterase
VFGHGPVDGVGAPINTLASVAECRERGADGIECDVRRTSDGHLVVTHDPVGTAPRSTLPGHVPDLAELLDACRGLTVNLEIKNFPRDPDFDPLQRVTNDVLELLASRGGRDDVLVSCFDVAALDVVKVKAPDVATALLYLSRRPAPDLHDVAVAHGHAVVHPYDTMVDGAFMAEARKRDLEVNVWLDEDESRLRELAALGVHGVITSAVTAARRVS